jgi:hypothetical protein
VWVSDAPGIIVGVLGFDLLAAFDTLDSSILLPKLERLRIKGKALQWFSSYLLEGQQCVEWNRIRSGVITVWYGVRQGSILGPMLYLVHVADMPNVVGVKDNENSGYTDDTAIWAVGRTVEEIVHKLDAIAKNFSTYAKGTGLVLNALKTQLLFSASQGTWTTSGWRLTEPRSPPPLRLTSWGSSLTRSFPQHRTWKAWQRQQNNVPP